MGRNYGNLKIAATTTAAALLLYAVTQFSFKPSHDLERGMDRAFSRIAKSNYVDPPSTPEEQEKQWQNTLEANRAEYNSHTGKKMFLSFMDYGF